MKTIEELEKMFDEFWEDWTYWDWSKCEIDRWIMFDFISNTIIPEVLKSVLPKYKDTHTKDDEINSIRRGNNNCIEEVKENFKKLYWIDL